MLGDGGLTAALSYLQGESLLGEVEPTVFLVFAVGVGVAFRPNSPFSLSSCSVRLWVFPRFMVSIGYAGFPLSIP